MEDAWNAMARPEEEEEEEEDAAAAAVALGGVDVRELRAVPTNPVSSARCLLAPAPNPELAPPPPPPPHGSLVVAPQLMFMWRT